MKLQPPFLSSRIFPPPVGRVCQHTSRQLYFSFAHLLPRSHIHPLSLHSLLPFIAVSLSHLTSPQNLTSYSNRNSFIVPPLNHSSLVASSRQCLVLTSLWKSANFVRLYYFPIHETHSSLGSVMHTALVPLPTLWPLICRPFYCLLPTSLTCEYGIAPGFGDHLFVQCGTSYFDVFQICLSGPDILPESYVQIPTWYFYSEKLTNKTKYLFSFNSNPFQILYHSTDCSTSVKSTYFSLIRPESLE